MKIGNAEPYLEGTDELKCQSAFPWLQMVYLFILYVQTRSLIPWSVSGMQLLCFCTQNETVGARGGYRGICLCVDLHLMEVTDWVSVFFLLLTKESWQAFHLHPPCVCVGGVCAGGVGMFLCAFLCVHICTHIICVQCHCLCLVEVTDVFLYHPLPCFLRQVSH